MSYNELKEAKTCKFAEDCTSIRSYSLRLVSVGAELGESLLMGCRKSRALPIDRSMLYLAEFLHRVQNEYTTAISLASAMAVRSVNPEAKAALSQIVDHLLASAKTHRLLLPRSPAGIVDFTADVTRLCRIVVSSALDQRGITLHLKIREPILLDSLRSWRANLILSELITNASRHAFEARGNRISVAITVACGQVVCTVGDNGSSVRAPKSGLGTQLVNAIAEDLQGGIQRCYSESGTVITLSFPKDSRSAKRDADSSFRQNVNH
jgi:two-component sensor histidine kinase